MVSITGNHLFLYSFGNVSDTVFVKKYPYIIKNAQNIVFLIVYNVKNDVKMEKGVENVSGRCYDALIGNVFVFLTNH